MIYDADGDNVGASTLASRLRQTLGDLGEDLSRLAPTWELAGMLRALVVAGRPLDVVDLGRKVDDRDVGRLADADEFTARARDATGALKTALAAGDPLADLAAFGVRRSPPTRGALPLTPAEQAAEQSGLITEATSRAANADRLLAQIAPETPRKALIEIASKTIATIFGGGFVAVPRLLPAPAGEADLWSGAVGSAGVRVRSGADIRPWLVRMSAVRATTSQYGATVLVRDALGRHPLLRVVQTPAGAYGTWVGLAFPAGRPPMAPLASMVVELVGAFAGDPEPDVSQALAGVLIDEWTEVIPRLLERHDPKNPGVAPELVDVTTTGIAINANAPGARPPQSILIALSPDGADWTGDRLVRVLDEALGLARMRTLTLPQLPLAGRYLPALYFRDWSLQGEPVIDWKSVATEFHGENIVQFLRVDQ